MSDKIVNMPEWIQYGRKFLVCGDQSLIIKAANICEDSKISAFLMNEKVIKGQQLFPKEYQSLLDLLLASGKIDEAAMIEILSRRFVAFATREITTYPEDGRNFIYNTCEQLAKLSADRKYDECEAIFAGSLGMANAQLGDKKKAGLLLEHSISLLKDLVLTDPETFRITLVRVLKTLSTLRREENKFDDALNTIEESIENCDQLVSINPNKYEWDLSLCLNEQANILQKFNKFSEAQLAYNQAIEIQCRWVNRNEKRYLPVLAGTYNNLGVCLTEQRQYDVAKTPLERCLAIRRTLYEKCPDIYTAELATTLNNFGHLLMDLREFQPSIQLLEECVELRSKLAKDQPTAFNPDFASALNSLGNVYLSSGRYNDARKVYSEAVKIRKCLAELDPNQYEPDYVQTLGNIAGYLRTASYFHEAREKYQEAINILRRLAINNGDIYTPKLAEFLGDYATTCYLDKMYEEAHRVYKNSIMIFQELLEKNPQLYAPRLAGTLNDLAQMLEEQGDIERALSTAKEAIALAEDTQVQVNLSKGDVLTSYRLLLENRLGNGTQEEVFQCIMALRHGVATALNTSGNLSLIDLCNALKTVETTYGKKICILVAQRMAQGRPFLGVIHSDGPDNFIYACCENIAEPMSQLFDTIQSLFGLTGQQSRFIEQQVIADLGTSVWEILPEFVQNALHPSSNHDVFISGDEYLNDFPWEALHFNKNDDDWLGLHRHLTRCGGLTYDSINKLRPCTFGNGGLSGAIICPWNVPGYTKLDSANIEANKVSKELLQEHYELVPDQIALIGNKATRKHMLNVLKKTPSLIHFSGHGDRLGNQEFLVLWPDEQENRHSAFIGVYDIAKLGIPNSQNQSKIGGLVVLNSCWTGRTREFGGQREDLVSALLDAGITAVVASPLPVFDELAGQFGLLLYKAQLQDKRGFGFTFTQARAIVERSLRETGVWAAWTMMHYHGNPFARLPHMTQATNTMDQEDGKTLAINNILEFFHIFPDTLEEIRQRIK